MKADNKNKQIIQKKHPFILSLSIFLSLLLLAGTYLLPQILSRYVANLNQTWSWFLSCVFLLIVLFILFYKNGYNKILKKSSYILSFVTAVFTIRNLLCIMLMIGCIVSTVLNARNTNLQTIPFFMIVIAFISIFMQCMIHEYIIRGLLIESMLVRFGKTRIGFVSTVLIATLGSAGCQYVVFKWLYGAEHLSSSLVFFVCLEFFLVVHSLQAVFDDITEVPKVNIFLRFSSYFGLYMGYAFFTNHTVTCGISQYSTVIVYCMLILSLFNLLPNSLNRLTALHTNRLYDCYGNILYLKRTKSKKVSKKKINTRILTEDLKSNSIIFFLIACVISLLIIGIYYAADQLLHFNQPVAFVQDHVDSILEVQISVTFLITTFLSFLSARDDLVLWTDTMEYKLVAPRFVNFIALASYSFTSLFFAIASYFFHWDYLVLLFFCIGILLLVLLTFSMINIYFHRLSILNHLEVAFFAESFTIQQERIADLYQNTCQIIGNNDLRRCKENFQFLVEIYITYQNFLKDYEIAKILKDKTVANQHLQIFIKYAPYPRLLELYSNDGEQQDEMINELKALIQETKEEIIYFVSMLLNSSPRMLVKMIDQESSGILEIPEINDILFQHLQNSNQDQYLNQQLMRTVFTNYLKKIEEDFEESSYVKLLNEHPEEKDKKKALPQLDKKTKEIIGELAMASIDQHLHYYLEQANKISFEYAQLQDAYINFIDNTKALYNQLISRI